MVQRRKAMAAAAAAVAHSQPSVSLPQQRSYSPLLSQVNGGMNPLVRPGVAGMMPLQGMGQMSQMENMLRSQQNAMTEMNPGGMQGYGSASRKGLSGNEVDMAQKNMYQQMSKAMGGRGMPPGMWVNPGLLPNQGTENCPTTSQGTSVAGMFASMSQAPSTTMSRGPVGSYPVYYQ